MRSEFHEEDTPKLNDIDNNPYAWWKLWTSLTGNSFRKKEPYSLIAELYVLKKLLEAKIKAEWGGDSQTIHDIETDLGDIEVKSTLSHHSKTVTIHGLFQLDSKPLELAFLRLERSEKNGISLSELIEQLSDLGEDRVKLINSLENMGYEENSTAVNEKYRIVEEKYFTVDENFPRIVPESFAGGQLPAGVTRIEYDISLDMLPGRSSCLPIETLKSTDLPEAV